MFHRRLDYALNRHYDPQQGRFTQVDPIEMDSVELDNPQTLNLYAYCGNDPVNSIDPDGLFWGKLWRGIKKILSNKWFMIAVAVALIVISQGWLGPLTKSFFSVKLGGFFGVTQVTQYTTVGIINAVLKGVAIASEIVNWSWKGVLQRGLNFGVGASVGSVVVGLGGSTGAGGTPEWNPNINDFSKRRPPPPRRGQPGSWYRGWIPVFRRVRPPPVGYSKGYPVDIPGGRETYRRADFRSEGEARFEAFRKMGSHPVEVEPGKWRSFDGRWQFRAKPIDWMSNHVHLERLNPATGQVLENWHFHFPAGTGRK